MRRVFCVGLLILGFGSMMPAHVTARRGCFLALDSPALLGADPVPKVRMENFERIWKAIDQGYYDPNFNGVDWKGVRERYRPMVVTVKTDGEFYDLMERMVGELHDSHTHVLSPALAQAFKKHQTLSLGFSYDSIEDRLVVTRVAAGSQAEKAGLEPGMIVNTIDGQPVAVKLAAVDDKFAESSSPRATRLLRYARAFGLEPGSTIRLGVERADGSVFHVTLTRETVPQTPELVAKVLPSGNA